MAWCLTKRGGIFTLPHTYTSLTRPDLAAIGQGVVHTVHSIPLFGRCPVRISAETPAILTQVSRAISRSLQANAGKVYPQLDHPHFLPDPLELIIHSTIRRHVISILEASKGTPSCVVG